MKTRKIETLDENLETVNVWQVPSSISLARVMDRQDCPKFRDLYLVSRYPLLK